MYCHTRAGDTRFATASIMIARMLEIRDDLVDTVEDDSWRAHMQPTAGRGRRVSETWFYMILNLVAYIVYVPKRVCCLLSFSRCCCRCNKKLPCILGFKELVHFGHVSGSPKGTRS